VIPFVGIDESKISPFHPFGVCCAIAFFTWDHVLMKMAVRRGFDRGDFRALTYWLAVFGWGFAWGIDALFYPSAAPVFSLQRFSVTGAIAGATVGTLLWSRFQISGWRITRRRIALLPVSEVIVGTWPIAHAIGRVGCALVHDHVGKSAAPGSLGSLLAVGFPRGPGDGLDHVFGPIHVITGASDVRFDLGLLEALLLAPLAIGFALSWKRNVTMGTYTMIATLVYGSSRFFFDFLRAEDGPTGDARFAGLTFAQYWSIAVMALGIFLFVRRRTRVPAHAT
jgi:phosphatidylglycerol:prolipoprotein diacylglycerol transferase